MARRARRYKDLRKTESVRRAEDRIALEEQEVKERGGGLFDDIPECKDALTRTWPKLEEARERFAREPWSPLKEIRKR